MLRQDRLSRRRLPYSGPGSTYYLPAAIWDETLRTLRWYGKYRSEGLVFWGGVVGGTGETLVTSLLRLNHRPQGAGVRPTPEAMRAMLRSLKARDEKLVAQAHSHPGAAFHSPGDSQRAASFHLGYVSIVVPNFGQGVDTLAECGVYEYRNGFVALTRPEIADRFVVNEQVVHIQPWRHEDPERRPWNALNRILNTIARRRP